MTAEFEELCLPNLGALFKAEPEILARIATVPGGGSLFLVHPFRLFADIGVVLSDECKAEICTAHPELSGLSDQTYDAVRGAAEPSMNVVLGGLFRKADS
jgi:hypothetical protein